jgi:hypothetical protein
MEDNKDKDISEFFSNQVRLSSNDVDYPLFFNDNKTVTIPASSRDNVLYSVKLSEQRDKLGLINFKHKKSVENAYTESEEYKKHKNEAITVNDETWNEYIKREDVKTKYYASLKKAVNDFVISQKQIPGEEYITTDEFKNNRFMFFFSNNSISSNAVVLLKCISRKDAILQSAHWIKYKYILPSGDTSNIDTILPDIYIYLSRNQIETKLRNGKSKILITKIDNIEIPFAILEL